MESKPRARRWQRGSSLEVHEFTDFLNEAEIAPRINELQVL
jgi:hypothetical protein